MSKSGPDMGSPTSQATDRLSVHYHANGIPRYLGTQLGLFCYSDVKAPASALDTTINDMCSVGVIYIAMAQSRVSRTEAHGVFGALG